MGLWVVSGAYLLERTGAGTTWSHGAFWLGYVIIVFPLAIALISPTTPRTDRLMLVVLLGLLTYAVKLLHDPFGFTISDEYTHLAATEQVLSDHRLFEQIPLTGVPVASGFPGLHAVTAALSAISGLSPHASGAIVIGSARLILMLALFLLFERISDSTRLAGIGTLLYAASPNFLFWSSQFSYESLSLPLFVVTLLAVISRRRAPSPGARLALMATAMLLAGAVIATHHITSYALVVSLIVLTALGARRGAGHLRAPALTIAAAAAALAWFLFVAKGTGSYLGFVATRTWQAVVDVANEGTRRPFEAAGGLTTPLPEKILAFGSAALICAGIVWALHDLWRRRRIGRAPALVLGAIGAGFLVLYPLKMFPGAWETANRSSDFLFIGVALLLAIAISARVQGRARRPRLAAGLATAFALICVTGGVIQGWPSAILPSQPIAVKAKNGATLRPQGSEAVAWAVRNLPPKSTYVADETSGRQLAVAGAHFVLAGRANGVPSLFKDGKLMPWERDLLAANKVDYVVVDDRRISANNLAGYFFQTTDDPGGGLGFYPDAVAHKFERLPRSRRVLDLGHVAIYDVRGLRMGPPPCRDTRRAGDFRAGSCEVPSAVLHFGGKANTIRFGAMTVRLLSSEVRSDQRGAEVTALIQVQNGSGRALMPDPDRRHMYLNVDGRRFAPARTADDRNDLFDGTRAISAGGKREGSLRFVVTGSAARDVLGGGGTLGVASLARHDPPDVGVLPILIGGPK
jgi:hypothetical protein